MRTHDEELSHRLILTALASGLKVRVKVSGLSMAPTLLPGEWVTVRPLKPGESPMVGSVAYVARDADATGKPRFVVHRVVGHDGDTAVTQGDSNLHRDRNTPCANVVGIVATRHSRACDFSLGDGLWSRWMTGAASGAAHRLNNIMARAALKLLRLCATRPERPTCI